MQIQKTNDTSFKSKYLTSAEVRFNQAVNKFKLYKMTPEDSLYLKNLQKSINLQELMPKLKPEDYTFWERILKQVLTTSDETILLTKDDKPCGALKYQKNSRHYAILGRVTWPLETGKREPFAGKVLIMQLYKMFLEDNLSLIKTCVCRYNPFSTISKCMEMGFRSNGGDNYNEIMSVNKERAKKAFEKFNEIIKLGEFPQ